MQGLNKGKKTALIWAGAILAGFILCECIVNAVAKHQLRTAVAQIPGADIQIGKIHLSLLAGNLELKHVDLSIRDTTDAGPDLEGRIKAIQLKHVHWFRLLKGEARADRLLLREPDIRLLLKAPKAEERPSLPSTTAPTACPWTAWISGMLWPLPAIRWGIWPLRTPAPWKPGTCTFTTA